MKQINIVNAYSITEQLAQANNLTIQGKWALYKTRKDLLSHYEFYMEESKKLFNSYETTRTEDSIQFKSQKLAEEYQKKQAEIDNLDVDVKIEKQNCKLSDIPDISVPQIEMLEQFIEFTPE